MTTAYFIDFNGCFLKVAHRFKWEFGNNFVRFVVSGLFPGPVHPSVMPVRESTIGVGGLRLKADEENFYHASKLWYSPNGYVNVGPWTLIPGTFNLSGICTTHPPLSSARHNF